MRRNGTASAATCRPIGWWTGADVFAYLARHDLPIHPAYACTMASAYDRDRVRVGTIGGGAAPGAAGPGVGAALLSAADHRPSPGRRGRRQDGIVAVLDGESVGVALGCETGRAASIGPLRFAAP